MAQNSGVVLASNTVWEDGGKGKVERNGNGTLRIKTMNRQLDASDKSTAPVSPANNGSNNINNSNSDNRNDDDEKAKRDRVPFLRLDRIFT